MQDIQFFLDYIQNIKTIQHQIEEFLNIYNNEEFQVEINEQFELNMKRGKQFFNSNEEMILKIQIILKNKFCDGQLREKCEEMEKNLIRKRNEMIDKIIMLMKNENIERKLFVQLRNEWNKKRIETVLEKQHREIMEMLEDINVEKQIVFGLLENVSEEKKESE